MRKYVWMLIVLVCIFCACTAKNTKRLPCVNPEIAISKDTSFLSTPVVIPKSLIKDKLNAAVKQDITGNGNMKFVARKRNGKASKIDLKIQRLGDIDVKWKQNAATYNVPLLILMEREIIGDKIIPISKSVALKTEFGLRLVFRTRVEIGTDWRLEPVTEFVSFEWLDEVRVFGGVINLKKTIERRIRRQMPEILKNLDMAIRTTVRLDRPMTRVWQNMQKPIFINRVGTLVWLKVHPIHFEMGKITSDSHNLLIQTRLTATTETMLGDTMSYPIDSLLPPLIKHPKLPNEGYVFFLSKIPYSDINTMLAQTFEGKDFEVSGHKIHIKQAEVWACDTNLVLHLYVQGDVQGDIYCRGKPYFEADSQQLMVRDLEYELETTTTIMASADWLLHSTLRELIQQKFKISLAQKIKTIPSAIMQGIERGQAGAKMDFTITAWTFEPRQIWVGSDDLAVLAIVHAQARVVLEKI